jgi:hypothetical protein
MNQQKSKLLKSILEKKKEMLKKAIFKRTWQLNLQKLEFHSHKSEISKLFYEINNFA